MVLNMIQRWFTEEIRIVIFQKTEKSTQAYLGLSAGSKRKQYNRVDYESFQRTITASLTSLTLGPR